MFATKQLKTMYQLSIDPPKPHREFRAAPILVSVSVLGRYCCFHEVSESAIIIVTDSYRFLSRARIK